MRRPPASLSASALLLILLSSGYALGDEHTTPTPVGGHTKVGGGPVDCHVMKSGKVEKEKVEFKLPKETDLDTSIVRQKEMSGRDTVIIRSANTSAPAKDGEHTVTIQKISVKGDEAVEINVRMKGEEVLGYDVSKVCGKGFGFPRPTAPITPVIDEDMDSLRALLTAGKSAIPGTDGDLEELKPPPSGGGGSSRPAGGSSGGSRPPSGGSSGGSRPPSGGSSTPKPAPVTPPKPAPVTPPKPAPVTPPKPAPVTPKPPTTGGGTTHPPTTGGGTTHPPTTGGGTTTHPPTTGGTPTTPKPVTPVAPPKADVPKPVNPNLKPDTSHKRETNPRDGSFVEDRGSHKVRFDKEGKVREVIVGDKVTAYRNDGTPAQVRQGRTTTTFKPETNEGGKKTVEKEVSHGGVKSYTEKTVVHNNQTTVQKTVYVNNTTTVVRNYNVVNTGPYVGFRVYTPVVYDPWVYRPFYVNPWIAPVPYTWGWAADPWYRGYGYYFTPYPTYSHPAYWLTDFVIADMLATQHRREEAVRQQKLDDARNAANAAVRDAQQAQHDAEMAQREAEAALRRVRNTAPVAIDQAIKDQIKLEVEAAIKAQADNKPITVADVGKDLKHIFAVSGEDIEATIEEAPADQPQWKGKPCLLTAGDLINLAKPIEAGDATATVKVKTSKKDSCPAGTVVTISLQDLQEYLNEFAARVSEGAGQAKEKGVIKEQK